MATPRWQILRELQLSPEGWAVLARGEWLAAAVQALCVPASTIARIQQACEAAIRRAWQRSDIEGVRLAVLIPTMLTIYIDGEPGWGFFLVERPWDPARIRCIEIFLYQDKG